MAAQLKLLNSGRKELGALAASHADFPTGMDAAPVAQTHVQRQSSILLQFVCHVLQGIQVVGMKDGFLSYTCGIKYPPGQSNMACWKIPYQIDFPIAVIRWCLERYGHMKHAAICCHWAVHTTGIDWYLRLQSEREPSRHCQPIPTLWVKPGWKIPIYTDFPMKTISSAYLYIGDSPTSHVWSHCLVFVLDRDQKSGGLA